MRRPHWRKMTWVLIIWCGVILAWAIAGGIASGASNDCGSQNLDKSACQAGTVVGIAIILLIGFFGFVFFSLIWFMTRPRR